MIGWTCLLMSTTLAASPVNIKGSARCPSSAEVSKHLANLLPASSAGGQPNVVELGGAEPAGGGRVSITLRRADGALLAQRSLDRDGACADLAAAAALVIATWESNVHPEFKLTVSRAPGADSQADRGADRRSDSTASPARVMDGASRGESPVSRQAEFSQAAPPPFVAAPGRAGVMPAGGEPSRAADLALLSRPVRSTASAAPARAAPAVRPAASLPSVASVTSVASVESSASSSPAGSTPRPAVSVPRPLPSALVTAPRQPVRSPGLAGSVVDVGLGVVAALSPSDQAVAGGGALAASWTGVSRWGARMGLLATTERTISLPAGEVNWRRASITLGPQRRWAFRGGRLNLDVHADVIAALLTMRGAGFASNGSDRAVDPGVGAGIRLSAGRGTWRPWLEVSTAAWLMRRLAYESPDNGAAPLPLVETTLALGCSFWNAL